MNPRWLLIGLSAGAVGGGLASALFAGPGLEWTVAHVTEPAGKVFLRLLFMLVIPLLFSALSVGIASIDVKQLGRMGARTLAYTVVVSAIAVAIGIALVQTIRPGEGAAAVLRDRAGATPPPAAPPQATGVDFFVQLIPDNPIRAAATGDMLGVLVFALFLGVGLALTRTPAADRLREALEGLYDVSMRLIGLVIRLAPAGVAALVFTLTARLGFEALSSLAWYVATVLLGLAIHQFVVYSLAVRLLGGMNPRVFFRGIRLAMITAFSTASSNATLPTALRVAEEELHLPRHVSRFVLTVGATMNQNGTALFEGVTVLFLAQLYGIDLTFAQQALVVGICILGGIGTAGVPAGSLPVVVMIVGMVGVPAEGVGLVLGVDRLLDMCRTTLNVTGDLAAAVVIARGEAGRTPRPASPGVPVALDAPPESR
jgi:DAACS family dicarboxylate/amino acid:cation (Na+ or H+) symporter